MKRRDALIEAHGQAAAAIRQYADQQGGLLGDDEEADETVRATLHELAGRHAAAVDRMTTSPKASGGAP